MNLRRKKTKYGLCGRKLWQHNAEKSNYIDQIKLYTIDCLFNEGEENFVLQLSWPYKAHMDK